jgi:hypothetical protein
LFYGNDKIFAVHLVDSRARRNECAPCMQLCTLRVCRRRRLVELRGGADSAIKESDIKSQKSRSGTSYNGNCYKGISYNVIFSKSGVSYNKLCYKIISCNVLFSKSGISYSVLSKAELYAKCKMLLSKPCADRSYCPGKYFWAESGRLTALAGRQQ